MVLNAWRNILRPIAQEIPTHCMSSQRPTREKMMLFLILLLCLLHCWASSSTHHMAQHGHNLKHRSKAQRPTRVQTTIQIVKETLISFGGGKSSSSSFSRTNKIDKELTLRSGGSYGAVNVTRHPLCCVRFVHIGKCAGTSFEKYAIQSRIPDAITFHHWAAFFEHNALLRPACIYGTALRHPGA